MDALQHYANAINLLRKKVQHALKRYQNSQNHDLNDFLQDSQMLSFQKKQYENLLANRLEGFAAAAELACELNLFNLCHSKSNNNNIGENEYTSSLLSQFNFKSIAQNAGYDYKTTNTLTSRVGAKLHNFKLRNLLEPSHSSSVSSSSIVFQSNSNNYQNNNNNENISHDILESQSCVKRLNEIVEQMLYEAISLYCTPTLAEPDNISEARCALKLATHLINNFLILQSSSNSYSNANDKEDTINGNNSDRDSVTDFFTGTISNYQGKICHYVFGLLKKNIILSNHTYNLINLIIFF